MRHKKHWLALALVVLCSFAILIAQGVKLHSSLPPIPTRVVDTTGKVLVDEGTISTGQNVWQSLGGQEVGSIWGHGAYVAPDWTADWLHREATFVLDSWAKDDGLASFEAAPLEKQAALKARLQEMMRRNTYDAATGTLTLAPVRAQAFEANLTHYADVFSEGRDAYAIPKGALTDPVKLRQMGSFFFWTSWVASTERPGDTATYTQNWPHEPLVANEPIAGSMIWSMASVVLLLAGIGALVAYRLKQPEEETPALPDTDPLFGSVPTPSQKAVYKYFAVVALLIVVQIGLGILTAHYGVEGSGLYGIPLAKWLPYAVTRSWHTQVGIFWIATAWLATGLYLAPAIGGVEPKFQRLGVNVLFGALLVIVVGSLAGQWLSVQQRLGATSFYWFGHQGYEYVDIGRFWQIFLFAGLFIWLGLMLRGFWPALKRKDESRPLLVLFVISSLAIASFYGAGLMYGQKSNLASVEYWRWWVVHLWVEGFFEVFATVAISFLLVRLGVLRAKTTAPAVLFATTIFLGGGIIGTLHHLYFTGTQSSALALGASFSALEVVPLSLIGFEVWQNLKVVEMKPWLARYKWPVYFFVAVSFWNLVGAGLFGFLINPPIALYYMQGLNLTPVHGHTALFGVYGMLGIGLMLFCLRALSPQVGWKERPLAIGFWALNGGLLLMVTLSLLPIGILQTMAAVEKGTWWARSADFLQTPLMSTLRWLRGPGDVVFAVGVLAIAYFVLGVMFGYTTEGKKPSGRTLEEPESDRGAEAPAMARST
ncbi:MAG: nitric-oxide reductase large subunit [Polyangiaceae bacterium]